MSVPIREPDPPAKTTAANVITRDCIYYRADGDPTISGGSPVPNLTMVEFRTIHRSELLGALASGRSPVVGLGGDGSAIDPDAVPVDGLVVSIDPVTEAVKRVDQAIVTAAVDRDSLAHIGLPMLIHRSTLARIVEEDDSEYVDLPMAVFRRGGAVVAAAAHLPA